MLALPLLTLSLAAVHPSLYFDAADVARYQAAASTTHKEIADALIAGSGYAQTSYSDPSVYDLDRPSAIVTFSIDCMITADASICQGAHDWLMAAVSDLDPSGSWDYDPSQPDFRQSGFVRALAIGYDVLSDPSLPVHLSASEQSAVKQRLIQGASWFYAKLTSSSPPWYIEEYEQNHNWHDYGALGVAALALYDETPDAPAWLQLVYDDFSKVGQVLGLITDGSWHEGYAYQGAAVAMWLRFPIALKHALDTGRVTGFQDLTDNPNLRAFAHYRALGSLPGKAHEQVLLHGDFFGFSNPEVLWALHWAAGRFGDGEAQWLAHQQAHDYPRNTYGYEQDSTAMEYLVFDPTVVETEPAAKDLNLTDLSGYISRSGYGANDVVLGVKAGAFGGLANWARIQAGGAPGGTIDFGHDHDDDLGFWLYGEGEWLAPEAAGYETHPQPTQGCPFAHDTAFHNSLTFDGVGQIGDGAGRVDDTGSSSTPWTRQGSVVAHASTANFTFVEMEGAALYPSSLGITGLTRQVLFVDRSTVAVRDHVVSTAAHQLEWHAHALDGATQDGSWLQGVGKNDKALAIRVISPSQWSATIEDQSPCINTDEVYDPDRTVSHMVVQSANAATEQRALAVMTPATVSGWANRMDVQPLGDVDQARGFTIDQARGSFVLGDAADTTKSGGNLTLIGKAGGVESTSAGNVYVLMYGTELQQADLALLQADANPGGVEADVHDQVVEITAEGATHARVYAPEAATATWNGAAISLEHDPADPRFVIIPAVSTSTGSTGSSGATGTSSGTTGVGSGTTGGTTGTGSTTGSGELSPSSSTTTGGSGTARGGCGATGPAELGFAWVAVAIALGRQRRKRSRA